MKHTIVFLGALFMMNISFAQGVEFQSLSWQAALDKAAMDNKMIFVDAYTTWCGPCKWMDKDVFPNESVGQMFNEQFVNIKLDMEKGEGLNFAKKYDIKGYPTFLFINGKGEVIHKSVGGRPIAELLDLGNAALDPERQVTTMRKRYESGEKSADFLKKYVDALTSAGEKDFEEIAKKYMDTQKDWTSKENIEFLFDYSEATMDSELFAYSMRNKQEFINVVGEETFYQKVDYAAELDRSKSGISRDDEPSLINHYAKYYPSNKAKNLAKVSFLKSLMNNRDKVAQEKFKVETQLFLASEPDLGWRFYNAAAWHIYENSSDQNLLTTAIRWAQVSIDTNENYHNLDTKAWLLYKTNNLKSAKAIAIRAIEKAREENENSSPTQELIQLINQKM